MALTGNTVATLADIARRLDKDGKIDKVAELLSQTNEVLEDMLFQEGNLPTGHKSTIRTGLPSAAWRLLNYGVPQSKSKTQQITDTCGMLEAYAEVDKALADLNNNAAEFRLSEDQAFLQAMNQEMANTLFYGDTSKNPERFLGLAPRFSTLNRTKAPSAENVIDAGGTAANALTSVYLTGWGANTIFGIYPKGSKAGFQHNNLGEVTLFDANGGKYQGYRTHYKWDIGLVVRDWRYIVRIANIDLASITDDELFQAMIRASEQLPDEKLGRPVFYMNRQTRTRLRIAKVEKSLAGTVTFDSVEGKKIMCFDEIPVKRCDAIVTTEARVVA
ncbi:MAG: hypothetical protein LBM00_06015 [Deltaproteobacteria bacterium]|jgi:hypothetical protein|nr:hypothetical protein [Deltaproteobacteria bacterium]